MNLCSFVGNSWRFALLAEFANVILRFITQPLARLEEHLHADSNRRADILLAAINEMETRVFLTICTLVMLVLRRLTWVFCKLWKVACPPRDT